MILPFIWRMLPGPFAIRVLVLLALIGAGIWCCFTMLFPWITERLPIQDDIY